MKREKWDKRLMSMAELVAGWSKDPSMKVGCVIANNKHVVSIGFNGLPKGMDDELVNDKERKLRYVIHAEENALLSIAPSVLHTTAYIWPIPPCPSCASKLVQAGVNRIVIINPPDKERIKYHLDEVSELLNTCGVDLTILEQN